jgi:hypothetical protein
MVDSGQHTPVFRGLVLNLIAVRFGFRERECSPDLVVLPHVVLRELSFQRRECSEDRGVVSEFLPMSFVRSSVVLGSDLVSRVGANVLNGG